MEDILVFYHTYEIINDVKSFFKRLFKFYSLNINLFIDVVNK